MMPAKSYIPLNLVKISKDNNGVVDVNRPRTSVTADSPAIDVMTDLTRVKAATIRPDVPLPEATQNMIHRGVRSLFVLDDAESMVGLLCADQVLGEAPVKLAHERGSSPAELTTRDLMVASERVEAVDFEDVKRSNVGHIASTLKRSGRHHLLVVEKDDSGKPLVCGLFSATQLARQLGIALPTGTIAQTFSEIEAALNA